MRDLHKVLLTVEFICTSYEYYECDVEYDLIGYMDKNLNVIVENEYKNERVC